MGGGGLAHTCACLIDVVFFVYLCGCECARGLGHTDVYI